MSKCVLSVELDRPDATYRPGETVGGKVHVEVDKDCRCDGLVLVLGWITHGRGNPAGAEVSTKRLFAGQWSAGASHSYPFSLVAPRAPLSYHGHYLNVDWHLEARADIPWAIDPTDEAEILIQPPEEAGLRVTPGGTSVAPTAGTSAAPTGGARVLGVPVSAAAGGAIGGVLGVLFGLVFAGVGGYFVWVSLQHQQWVNCLIGAVFAVVGLRTIYATFKKRIARSKLGDVKVTVKPSAPGDEHLLCELSCQETPGAQINEISATLHVREIVTSGSGTNRRTHIHPLYTRRRVMKRSGRTGPWEARLELDRDQPCSFHVDDNTLSWSVAFQIDIANWPDWSDHVQLSAVPVPPVGA